MDNFVKNMQKMVIDVLDPNYSRDVKKKSVSHKSVVCDHLQSSISVMCR